MERAATETRENRPQIWVLDDDSALSYAVEQLLRRQLGQVPRTFRLDVDFHAALASSVESGDPPLLIWTDLIRFDGFEPTSADGRVVPHSRELPAWLSSTELVLGGVRLRAVPHFVHSAAAQMFELPPSPLRLVVPKPATSMGSVADPVHWLLAASLARLSLELEDAGVPLDEDRLPVGTASVSTASLHGSPAELRPYLASLRAAVQQARTTPEHRPESTARLSPREAARTDALLQAADGA